MTFLLIKLSEVKFCPILPPCQKNRREDPWGAVDIWWSCDWFCVQMFGNIWQMFWVIWLIFGWYQVDIWWSCYIFSVQMLINHVFDCWWSCLEMLINRSCMTILMKKIKKTIMRMGWHLWHLLKGAGILISRLVHIHPQGGRWPRCH